jgi:hypothetical protein
MRLYEAIAFESCAKFFICFGWTARTLFEGLDIGEVFGDGIGDGVLNIRRNSLVGLEGAAF